MKKLVKERLNEKFTQNSDPIRDMGIGGINIHSEYTNRVLPSLDDWFKYLIQTFLGKSVTFINKNTNQRQTIKVSNIKLENNMRDALFHYANIIFEDENKREYYVDIKKSIFIDEEGA